MSAKLSLVIFLLAIGIGTANAENILGVFTSISPSHIIIHMAHAKALVERGHNVTVVTSIPLKERNPGFNHIYIPRTEASATEIDNMKSQMGNPRTNFQKLVEALQYGFTFIQTQYETLKDQRFQDFMHNSDNKFDLVIIGYGFNDFQIGLGHHFNCPVVISWVFSPIYFVNRLIGNPTEVAYVNAMPLTEIPDQTSFIGRLANFVLYLTGHTYSFFTDRSMEGYYKELFPSDDYPPFKEMTKKVSLVLSNYHFSDGVIRPNVPALIEVGGIQIKDKADPLPEDLRKIIDASSEHGVIYLSFGTNSASKDLNPKTTQTIFKALVGLKQTVLWKWDSEEKPGYAENIHYREWLPQDDILAEPSLRLFITHAGKGSVIESQYHGVPMVAIPLFADQSKNAGQMVKDGYGLQIDLQTMTVETLQKTVLNVIENSSYREKVRTFSTLYRDRPMTAKQTSIYWIEYVLRHKGAYHMQSPLVHLNGLQSISADVVAFLLLVAFLVYKLIKVTIGYALRKVCGLLCSNRRKVKNH